MSSPPLCPDDAPRPSLDRTTISGVSSQRSLSSQSHGYGGWEQSDIRGDLVRGWGSARSTGTGAPIFRSAAASDASGNNDNNINNNNSMQDDWGWRLHNKAVHPVPAFYPMDPRSSRRIDLVNNNQSQSVEGGVEEMKVDVNATVTLVGEISHRISTACQKLSIHGIWDNTSPSATLFSMERVEMEITFFKGEAAASPQLLVELQRRKGCSVTFHNYRRCLLDAAEGKFNPDTFNETDGLDKPLGRDRANQPRASLGRPGLARPSMSPSRPSLARPSMSPRGSPIMERPSPMGRPSPFRPSPVGSPDSSPSLSRPSLRAPSFSADDAAMPIAGLKTEGDAPMTPVPGAAEDKSEKALKALNMAASLIKKDRVDARRLGLESLVLLTDPLRAGIETAQIASRVVLLGSANDDASMGDDVDDVDALFDESAGLGIRETILEMIMADSTDEKMKSEEDGFEGIEKEFTDSLFNLCLTVLSNALHTIEESVKTAAASNAGAATSTHRVDQDDSDDENQKLPPADSPSPNRRRAATEPSNRPSGLSKRFIDDTNSTFGMDVLSSLIRILGQAKSSPHDAYHSARCLGVLFKGCGNSHKDRARRDLDAKRIIAAALEVGSKSHAKLEDASRVAMMALVTDDEESVEEEGETTQMENEQVQEENDEAEQLPLSTTTMEQSISGDNDDRL
mmetsp:Transcript_22611/g.38742  ORF Transcript_22611/g.38742 Transcript_22611/m.38742 type:complete len:682 (-) Transcript_22611:142-2187(-)|eukprot:CAMPEP_0183728876 /NCGR_PEP_ID=MMETSP0737-20130205/29142_1 /TAXON_ID=385413 /ORGANISM="Thalassiosira miniscula, Strain CCMP1093" /LENGTH=681 /DNA_ID=CAMNT_0025960929 /DNA_START=505 /DNA_END=2550 /DNA_ORIENTATION=-